MLHAVHFGQCLHAPVVVGLTVLLTLGFVAVDGVLGFEKEGHAIAAVQLHALFTLAELHPPPKEQEKGGGGGGLSTLTHPRCRKRAEEEVDLAPSHVARGHSAGLMFSNLTFFSAGSLTSCSSSFLELLSFSLLTLVTCKPAYEQRNKYNYPSPAFTVPSLHRLRPRQDLVRDLRVEGFGDCLL